MKECVLITGAAGAIGQALIHGFVEAGYAVIGTDMVPRPDALPCDHYIQADLQRTINDENYAAGVFTNIEKFLGEMPLAALINNAAAQILGPVENLDRHAWRTTLDVNLLAPFFWAQAFLRKLEASRGMVLNISSIHSRLTKPGFAAYATSKAALSGLTRAMAVELGNKVRVNAIEPAAIETAMLRAGFIDNPDGYKRLAAHHPTGEIGSPRELAQLACTLVSKSGRFFNGSIITMDGGISARLHDPD